MSTQTLNSDATIVGTSNGVGILVAPVGTPGPENTHDAWPAGWEALGFLHEDGLELGLDITTEQLRAWQSKSPLRTIVTGKELTIDFAMIEVSPRTMAMFFDEPVPGGTAELFRLRVTSEGQSNEYAVGIDTRDGDSVLRYMFPRSSLSSNGSINIEAADFQGLPVTLMALDHNGMLADILRGPAEPPVAAAAPARSGAKA